MVPYTMLPLLQDRNVISVRRCALINCPPTNELKNRKLLDFMRRGSYRMYKHFTEALKELDLGCLAKVLEHGGGIFLRNINFKNNTKIVKIKT